MGMKDVFGLNILSEPLSEHMTHNPFPLQLITIELNSINYIITWVKL